MKTVPEISELTYKCEHCGFMCTKKTVPELTRTKTKIGNYGTNCTPTPTVFYDEQYVFSSLGGTDNLITNGEMELDSNWNDHGSPSVNERSSEQTYSGNYSRKFTGLVSAGIKSDTFTTVTDQQYFGEFWIYPVDCTEVTILVRRGDDSGNSHGAYGISGLGSNTWTKYEFTYTETGGGSGAYIALYKANTYYIDDVSIGSGSKVIMGLRFVAETSDTPAKIIDSANKFADKQFRNEQPIKIETTSGTNDGTYTIAARGVSRGTLTLSDDDSLTTENAATAGEVTISDVTYEPKVTTGCPFCGSLNNK